MIESLHSLTLSLHSSLLHLSLPYHFVVITRMKPIGQASHHTMNQDIERIYSSSSLQLIAPPTARRHYVGLVTVCATTKAQYTHLPFPSSRSFRHSFHPVDYFWLVQLTDSLSLRCLNLWRHSCRRRAPSIRLFFSADEISLEYIVCRGEMMYMTDFGAPASA
jgi:hypothetical protein